MITQTVIEMCNNCYNRFWIFDSFTPLHCMKCELLGLPDGYTLAIGDGRDGQ